MVTTGVVLTHSRSSVHAAAQDRADSARLPGDSAHGSVVAVKAMHRTRRPGMTVKFFPNDKGNPPGKLADAELHFSGGPLDGLKLIGFGIWERKNGGRNVTFPARQYSVNGERRSFSLLRPVVDSSAQDRLRDLILEAYKGHEAELATAV
jgi:hypothetical protein